MLNLNELKTKKYEVMWFDGSVLQLRKPSQRTFERLAEMSELKENDVKTLMNIVYELLFDIFNNNVNGRKFTEEEIKDNFDLETAFIFIQDYMQDIIPHLGE